jgi:site-specific DNA-methyltransferase (adenine-specific)
MDDSRAIWQIRLHQASAFSPSLSHRRHATDKEVRLSESRAKTAKPENAILHGDCLEAMAALPEGCVDLAFADPPFNIGYEYDVYDDAQEHQAYLDWSQQWIAAVHRVLKPTGTFWLAIGDEYAAELKLIAQNDVGFHCRSWVVWYYTFGVNCKYKFSRSHAHLFYFVKDAKQFTFNNQAIRVPSARQLVYADGRANPSGRLPDDTWILRPQDLVNGFTVEEDTWYFPRVAGTFKERAGFHGCQMPEQLLGRIIRACSNPGELVLDPFSGSATTLVVAKKLGRRWLGFDLSEEYVQRGTDRLERTREGDALDGAPEPLVSAPATAEGKKLEDGPRKKRRVFVKRQKDQTLFEAGGT